jgi:hypothetical protein
MVVWNGLSAHTLCTRGALSTQAASPAAVLESETRTLSRKGEEEMSERRQNKNEEKIQLNQISNRVEKRYYSSFEAALL